MESLQESTGQEIFRQEFLGPQLPDQELFGAEVGRLLYLLG